MTHHLWRRSWLLATLVLGWTLGVDAGSAAQPALLEVAGHLSAFLESGGWIAWGAVPTEDEIRKAIEEQHKQTSGESAGQNQTTLEGGERRAELLNDLLTLKYYESEVLKNVVVTPPEIENYYKENHAQYQIFVAIELIRK
jgi:hypothetical protein